MVCIMKKTKVIMFMRLNGSGPPGVDKLELFLLDDIAIKVYEFVLWWPLWVLKKNPNRPSERAPASQRHADFKMLQTASC